MAEYIERGTAIAWFMPYAHAGESIDADIVISDIKGMKAADVAPVVHGRWHKLAETKLTKTVECTHCHYTIRYNKKRDVPFDKAPFCLNCGCKIEGVN